MTALERLEKRQNELALVAKRSLGQNFLVSDAVINKIISAVEDFTPKSLIEIGPGCGALTDLLLPRYPDMKLIELDRGLASFWRAQGAEVIEGDALRIDWNFSSESVLVSNLPYQISSSLVIERSVMGAQLRGMVLMFQKEVAQRIRAQTQTEHYGMLSVVAQEFWQIETVCDAGSREFKPAPKVSSRVLKFTAKTSSIADRPHYLRFVKSCFQQRRRVLSTNLAAWGQGCDLTRFSVWIENHKKSDKIRAEELSVPELNSLYHFLFSTSGQV